MLRFLREVAWMTHFVNVAQDRSFGASGDLFWSVVKQRIDVSGA